MPLLGRLFKRREKPSQEPAAEPERSVDDTAIARAHAYLDQIRQKMERLAEDFAAGKVNTTQFQELYAHYQQERRAIEETLEETPEAAAWRATVAAEHLQVRFPLQEIMLQGHCGGVLPGIITLEGAIW